MFCWCFHVKILSKVDVGETSVGAVQYPYVSRPINTVSTLPSRKRRRHRACLSSGRCMDALIGQDLFSGPGICPMFNRVLANTFPIIFRCLMSGLIQSVSWNEPGTCPMPKMSKNSPVLGRTSRIWDLTSSNCMDL